MLLFVGWNVKSDYGRVLENVKEIDYFQGKYKLPKVTQANSKSSETTCKIVRPKIHKNTRPIWFCWCNICSFSKLYFIDYGITVVPIFSPLSPSTQHFPLPQAIPTPLFMSIDHGISSLATTFPRLYFTSPWLFCTCLFVLFKPLTSSPNPPHPVLSGKHQNTLHIHDYVCSCLLSLFF